MPVYGKIIVIRRNGTDGSQFPITNETCVFGRGSDCDIRVQLPYVSNEQCKLTLKENGEFMLHDLSESNPTEVNGKPIQGARQVCNKDIFTIVDRSFRFEYPENFQNMKVTSKSPSQKTSIKTPLRERQVASITEDKKDSPFGILVHDMKNIIKNSTPRQRKKRADENRKEEINVLASSKNSLQSNGNTPKRRSSTVPRRQSRANSEPLVNSNEQDLNTKLQIADEVPETNATTRTKSLENKDAMKLTKPISNPNDVSVESDAADIFSTSMNLFDKSTSVTPIKADSLTTETNHPATLENTEAMQVIDVLETPQTIPVDDDVFVPTTVNETEESSKLQNFSNCVDTVVSSNSLNISIHSVRESLEKDMLDESLSNVSSIANETADTALISEDQPKRRSSKRRSSLLKHLSAISLSEKDDEDVPVSILVTSKHSVRESLEKDMLDESLSNVSSIANETADTALISEDQPKRRSSKRRSSLLKHLSAISLSEKDDEDLPVSIPATSTSRQESMIVNESISSTSNEDPEVPSISLTPVKDSPKVVNNVDPYDFFDVSESNQKKTFRRRSHSGCGGTRKQQLLSLGSPRIPKSISLHSNLGNLRRKSEPLIECDEESVSPVSNVIKKQWDPLPETVEVENNSSPIKKPRLNSRTCSSPLTMQECSTKKARRVSFGPNLSPEQFCNHFPPNTPIKKGATPAKQKSRASLATTTLDTVKEDSSSPTPKAKVTRTPTPFKPDPRKTKSKSLLQQVLHTAIENKSQMNRGGSPILRSRKSRSSVMDNEDSEEANSTSFPNDTKVDDAGGKLKRRSGGRNVPIVNVHKTATNLQRRKSGSRPLWSDIVKKGQTTGSKVAQKKQKTEKKKSLKKATTPRTNRNGHHINSPATLYIGKTKYRLQPTRTPRPIKSVMPTKLDIPLDESYTGMSDMFATPTSEDCEEFSICDDLQTPNVSSEMFVSPLQVTSSQRRSSRLTPMSFTELDNGASPNLNEIEREKSAASYHIDITCLSTADLFIDESNEDDSFMIDIEEPTDISVTEHHIMNQQSSRTREKCQPVKEHFGTKRIFTTPKDKKWKTGPTEEYFGTKRMFTTPKDKKRKAEPVEEHFGTKRMFTTPKDKKGKAEPVEEHFGTKRMFTTPKDKKGKAEPVEEHFGTKRMFTTPKDKKGKAESVEEHFGTKRMFTTPKDKKGKTEPVAEHFGTKRMFTTPKDKKGKTKPVEEHFGTKRMFTTPKDKKGKTEPVAEHFGTKRMFTTPKDKKRKTEPTEEHFGMKRMFTTPKDKQKPLPVDGNYELNMLFLEEGEIPTASSKENLDGLSGLFENSTVQPISSLKDAAAPITPPTIQKSVGNTPALSIAKADSVENQEIDENLSKDIALTSGLMKQNVLGELAPKKGSTRRTKLTDNVTSSLSVESASKNKSNEAKKTKGSVQKAAARVRKVVTFHDSVKPGDVEVPILGKRRKATSVNEKPLLSVARKNQRKAGVKNESLSTSVKSDVGEDNLLTEQNKSEKEETSTAKCGKRSHRKVEEHDTANVSDERPRKRRAMLASKIGKTEKQSKKVEIPDTSNEVQVEVKSTRQSGRRGATTRKNVSTKAESKSTPVKTKTQSKNVETPPDTSNEVQVEVKSTRQSGRRGATTRKNVSTKAESKSAPGKTETQSEKADTPSDISNGVETEVISTRQSGRRGATTRKNVSTKAESKSTPGKTETQSENVETPPDTSNEVQVEVKSTRQSGRRGATTRKNVSTKTESKSAPGKTEKQSEKVETPPDTSNEVQVEVKSTRQSGRRGATTHKNVSTKTESKSTPGNTEKPRETCDTSNEVQVEVKSTRQSGRRGATTRKNVSTKTESKSAPGKTEKQSEKVETPPDTSNEVQVEVKSTRQSGRRGATTRKNVSTKAESKSTPDVTNPDKSCRTRTKSVVSASQNGTEPAVRRSSRRKK